MLRAAGAALRSRHRSRAEQAGAFSVLTFPGAPQGRATYMRKLRSHKSRTCPRSPGQWVQRQDSNPGCLDWQEAFPLSGCSIPTAREDNHRVPSLSFPIHKMGLILTPSSDSEYSDKSVHIPHQAQSLAPGSHTRAHSPALTRSA